MNPTLKNTLKLAKVVTLCSLIVLSNDKIGDFAMAVLIVIVLEMETIWVDLGKINPIIAKICRHDRCMKNAERNPLEDYEG